ncbi:MAG TPA: universal stress protein [Burkholderiaceae bacterium]
MINGSDMAQAATHASDSGAIGVRPEHYRHILLPFDASIVAHRALDEAIALARERGARIELFHMFDPAAHVSGFEPGRLLVEELLPRARTQARSDLEAAAQSVRSAGVECDMCLIEGDVGDLPDAIVRQVSKTGADLVVMGTHGRTGIDRILEGSIAEQLLRRANVPVLLIRAADDQG